jgi:hypothetical protein
MHGGMKKIAGRKLALNKETLRSLSGEELSAVGGGTGGCQMRVSYNYLCNNPGGNTAGSASQILLGCGGLPTDVLTGGLTGG